MYKGVPKPGKNFFFVGDESGVHARYLLRCGYYRKVNKPTFTPCIGVETSVFLARV